MIFPLQFHHFIFVRRILESLYNTLIFPNVLQYCSGKHFSVTSKSTVYVLQRRAVRLIYFIRLLGNTADLFKELTVWNVFDIYKDQMGIFMFKIEQVITFNVLESFILIQRSIYILFH